MLQFTLFQPIRRVQSLETNLLPEFHPQPHGAYPSRRADRVPPRQHRALFRRGDGHGRGRMGRRLQLLMAVAIVAFSWWASGWITAPLSEFARASERLGVDVKPRRSPRMVPWRSAGGARLQPDADPYPQLRRGSPADVGCDLTRPSRTDHAPEAAHRAGRARARRPSQDVVRPHEMAQMVNSAWRSLATRRPRKLVSRWTSPRFSIPCATTRSMPGITPFRMDRHLVYQGRPWR